MIEYRIQKKEWYSIVPDDFVEYQRDYPQEAATQTEKLRKYGSVTDRL